MSITQVTNWKEKRTNKQGNMDDEKRKIYEKKKEKRIEQIRIKKKR